MPKLLFFLIVFTHTIDIAAQVKWTNMDTSFGSLPKNFHVFKTNDSLDEKPFIAYYAIANLKDKRIQFTADSTLMRRLTPQQFYKKNREPLLVVNTTFFSYATNQNLNVLIKDGKILGYNIHSQPGRGKDTFTYTHPLGSALGISKKREADIAWLFTDTLLKHIYALQHSSPAIKDSLNYLNWAHAKKYAVYTEGQQAPNNKGFKKWKMKTAIRGGPVLLQNGEVLVSNNEELKFAGKATNDQHPRTCMGYTKDGKLIIMVIQGRYVDAAGATLLQEAQLLKEIGCEEAINLDGGGSSCMLINGMETIKPSDKEGQRPVPGVFIINIKR